MFLFFFSFVYVVDYIDRFSYVETSLHLLDESWWMTFCMYVCVCVCVRILFASILLITFASVFMRETGLTSFCGLGP